MEPTAFTKIEPGADEILDRLIKPINLINKRADEVLDRIINPVANPVANQNPIPYSTIELKTFVNSPISRPNIKPRKTKLFVDDVETDNLDFEVAEENNNLHLNPLLEKPEHYRPVWKKNPNVQVNPTMVTFTKNKFKYAPQADIPADVPTPVNPTIPLNLQLNVDLEEISADEENISGAEADDEAPEAAEATISDQEAVPDLIRMPRPLSRTPSFVNRFLGEIRTDSRDIAAKVDEIRAQMERLQAQLQAVQHQRAQHQRVEPETPRFSMVTRILSYPITLLGRLGSAMLNALRPRLPIQDRHANENNQAQNNNDSDRETDNTVIRDRQSVSDSSNDKISDLSEISDTNATISENEFLLFNDIFDLNKLIRKMEAFSSDSDSTLESDDEDIKQNRN